MKVPSQPIHPRSLQSLQVPPLENGDPALRAALTPNAKGNAKSLTADAGASLTLSPNAN